ncbi:hypothetical protein J1N35_022836 [Gossypium stocksii]|uniref:Uncharacterized protein n=1 Tax=Gossypium stocksii TaxID=47602 RepID=A0A9D3VGR5_9ROSI|nr:hypothetical protein J1N35_022836 [Gossypium stocksii]
MNGREITKLELRVLKKSALTTDTKGLKSETSTIDSKTSKPEASQPAQAGASPSNMGPGFVPPNPFDFSAMSGLLELKSQV